ARSRKERAQTLGGAVKAIDKDSLHLIGWLLLGCGTRKHPIGLGKGRSTGLLRVAEMPEHTTTDDRGEGHFRCQTAAVFFIPQEVCGQRQPTPSENGDDTLEDEVGQDSEYAFTGRALQTPDHDPTQPDPDIMGVARQAPAPITGRLMFQLKANGQDKGEDTFDQHLAVSHAVEASRFLSQIHPDNAVLSP